MTLFGLHFARLGQLDYVSFSHLENLYMEGEDDFMNQRISLDGTWQCTGLDEHRRPLAVEAKVPGCVHTDLMRGGVIDYDIFWRDNHTKCLWIERTDFTYTRTFTLEEIGPRPKLVFEGLDTYCEVFLNGHSLGEADDMFIRHEFAVDDCLRTGENELKVCFRSPLFTEQFAPRPAAFTAERLYTRRMQCTYGWDWVARFVTMGIFRDVYLEFSEGMRVEDIYIYTKELDAHGAQVMAEISLADVREGDEVEVLVRDPGGEPIYRHVCYCKEPLLREYIDVLAPCLWMPNGYGEQPLYELQVSVGGRVDRMQSFGIVKARVLEAPDRPGSEYDRRCRELQKCAGKEYDSNEAFSGFQLLVNGCPVMCKGANWVPSEPFPSSETPERIAEILRMAKEAGVNMIRVWGGGIFEQDCFYDTCDRLGLMVTQDFLMACGHYPEEEEAFLEALRREAAYAARKLRNHPCLMWWTGDNENAIRGHDRQPDFQGRTAALQAIGPVLHRYDPQRRFFASSPYGGTCYASKTKGTTHNTQFMGDLLACCADLDDYKAYLKEYTARFIAEEPIFGAAEATSLRAFMTDADICEGDDMWRCHTKTNPGLEIELFDYVQGFAANLFGAFRDGRDRLIKLQYLQYEWVRVTLENARRNQGFCNGLIYWMLNDCWPAASGWSIIDYYLRPKAGYYAFKRCAQGVMVSVDAVDGQLQIYVCNDTAKAQTVDLQVSILAKADNIRRPMGESTATVAPYESRIVATFSADVLQGRDILLCRIEGEGVSDRTFYQFGHPYLTPAEGLHVERIAPDRVRLTADRYIHAVHLEGDCVFADNYFPLWAGESREIGISDTQAKVTAAAYSILEL